MLLKEAWGRKAGTLLGVLAVALACGLVVLIQTLFKAVDAETTKHTKNQGFNVVFLPKDTDLSYYWANDCSDKDMPEDYVDQLVSTAQLTADHSNARLERRVDWDGRTVLLTGNRKTVASGGKSPLGVVTDEIKSGTAQVGQEIGAAIEKVSGKRLFDNGGRLLTRPDGSVDEPVITVLGEKFKVTRSLTREKADPKDNIRIYVNMKDAQRLFSASGRINAIYALTCRCKGTYATVMKQLSERLPEAQAVIPDARKWKAREDMRGNVERLTGFAVPVLLLVAAAWVATLCYLNVRQRREEIGLLRAVGAGSLSVAVLFVGKAVLVGLLGAALGFALGTGASMAWGPGIFDLPAGSIKPAWPMLAWSAALAPALAALAAAGPAMFAVYLDPAEALRQE
jgi:putative ABC transport system permease protein